MIDKICQIEECTGCRACEQVCPVKCIKMLSDEFGQLKASVTDKCIECGKCIKTCPNNSKIEFKTPIRCYAGWSTDDNIRFSSASGGIAATIYRYCISHNIKTFGCVITPDGYCHYKEIKTDADIKECQNSKYVFSDTESIYTKIRQALISGENVIFIGLPCQVAGLYRFLNRAYDNLTTIDLVCHGVAPAQYLKQHIETISGKHLVNYISFREPVAQTHTYQFHLSDHSRKWHYRKYVYDNDTYQVGFHKSLIYRDNCYECKYARLRRISDLTISDFSGLGRLAPWDKSKINVSCILLNSNRGENLLTALGDTVALYERPLNEALNFEHQLKAPSTPHSRRSVFLDTYSKTHDFDKAVKKAAGKQLRIFHLKKVMHIMEIKRLVVRLFPSRLKCYIKSVLR